MKEPSLETKLQRAKEEGEKLKQQAENRGNPAFTPPDSLPLTQEKAPNKFEVLAFQLEEFLKKPLVYNEVVVAESAEKVFEGEEGKKRLEVLGRDMAEDAKFVAEGHGGNAQDFITVYTALSVLSQDAHKLVLNTFKEHSGKKTFEDVLPDILPMLGKTLGESMRPLWGGTALDFIVIRTTLPMLSKEAQQTVREIFRINSDGETFEDVLPDVLLVLGEGMAESAQNPTEDDERWFFNALSTLSMLSQGDQTDTLRVFKEHSDGKTFEEVLSSILPALGEDMARDAYEVGKEEIGSGWSSRNARRLLSTLTSIHTLITHYRKLANEQKKEDELNTEKNKQTEPIIPPKNF